MNPDRCKTTAWPVLVATLATSTALADAPAPTKDQCFDAFEKAQAEQKAGKLRDAHGDFAICVNAACPKPVRADCTAGLASTDKNMASVRFKLTGDPTGVEVTIDRAAPRDVPGDALPLDPGEHSFHFTAADGRSFDKQLRLSEGQKDVELAVELVARPAAPPAPPVKPEPSEPQRAKQSPVPFILGGVAVVGLAGFVGFGLAGKSKQSDLDACKPDCQRSDVDDMRKKYLLADISLGVALVAGGVGAYLYMSSKQPTEKAIWLKAVPEAGGSSLRFGARF